MSDKPEKALDALHAELADDQKEISNLVRNSLHTEAEEIPPMPDTLLDDVLGDLGVKKAEETSVAAAKPSFFELCLEIFSGKPMALAGLAAAACVVVMLAINLNNNNGDGPNSSVRGGAGEEVAEAPLIVFPSSSPELRAAALEHFQSDHLEFPAAGEDLDTKRNRIVIENDTIKIYHAGESTAVFEGDASTDLQQLMDRIAELTHEFELQE